MVANIFAKSEHVAEKWY